MASPLEAAQAELAEAGARQAETAAVKKKNAITAPFNCNKGMCDLP